MVNEPGFGASSIYDCDFGHFRVGEQKEIHIKLEGASTVTSSVSVQSSSRTEANMTNNSYLLNQNNCPVGANESKR